MKSVLIVCRGNICRSPMAAGYFSHYFSQNNIEVSSAGISALVNQPADPHAEEVMKRQGIDISGHRARQITENIIRKADLIFVMSHSQLNTVIRQFAMAKGKTFLLGHWQNTEIQDPFTQPYEIFEKVYQKIVLAGQEWKKRILECQTNSI